MGVIFQCRDLQKRFGPVAALDGLDLQIESGKIVGLLGPNGSGKTTLIKLANGLISPSRGNILIDGIPVGVETKRIVSYLPDRNYLSSSTRVKNVISMFSDFYEDFSKDRAYELLGRLNINAQDKLKTMSKGTREKVQLILVMSRKARLYFLDEPIAGVDPAARDYILNTILNNYNPEASIVISTHLIADIEQVLDEVIFIKQGHLVLHQDKKILEAQRGMTIDEIFREEFRC